MPTLDEGLLAGAVIILIAVPAYAAFSHRSRVRSRLKMTRTHNGRLKLLQAFGIYLIIDLATVSTLLGVRTVIAYVPQVPELDFTAVLLGSAVVGGAVALSYVPRVKDDLQGDQT